MTVRRASLWGLIVLAIGAWSVGSVHAGPWSQLPDAVARLQYSSADSAAAEVLRGAESSVLDEASAGRIAPTALLVEAYGAHVAPLANGDLLIERLQRQVAAVLVGRGDATAGRDPERAAQAWALAARLDPGGIATDRLTDLLLPPAEPEPGDRWRSPVDGAVLVFQPATAFRLGCSPNDRSCRDDERFFRWMEIDALWVDRAEVTNDRYRGCVAAGWCEPPVDVTPFEDPSRSGHPVVGVTWRQAASYASWAGRRLPSEAEWERTARGKAGQNRFPWPPERADVPANVLPEQALALGGTAPVGSYDATGWGVVDIAGNVYEWCEDRYRSGFKQVPDDGGPVRDGWGRVIRGGSWRRTVELARVSARDWRDDGYRADDLGFRCALGRREGVPVRDVIRLATRLYPSAADAPDALAGADLAASDRRYLERRALTWLVLENRIPEALEHAGRILESGGRDPVVAAFLDRFERDLLAEIQTGDIEQATAWLEAFRRTAEDLPRIERRLRDQESKLREALGTRGEEALRAGRRHQARIALEAVLTLDPSDRVVPRLLEATVPTAGEIRVWEDDGREMAWVPGGAYRMGASAGDAGAQSEEHPARVVRIEGFWLDRREVTNADYRRCVEAGACTPPGRTIMYDDPNLQQLPVMWVDWHQARSYARWAGKRLPTEVEWERAARAGQETRYPWGSLWNESAANVLGTAGDDRFGGAAPVGSFVANRWGLSDMLGNAAEWVEDLYHRDYRNAPRDGRAWNRVTGEPIDDRRVIRGGSYDDPPARTRVSSRASRPPLDGHRTTGFRCAADDDATL